MHRELSRAAESWAAPHPELEQRGKVEAQAADVALSPQPLLERAAERARGSDFGSWEFMAYETPAGMLNATDTTGRVDFSGVSDLVRCPLSRGQGS